MRISVILVCILLCAITFVGCDKQEDEVLVSASTILPNSTSGTSSGTMILDGVSYFALLPCMDEVPFVISGHSYLPESSNLGDPLLDSYGLSFTIYKNSNYNGQYQVDKYGNDYLHPDFGFTGTIQWTVEGYSSVGDYSTVPDTTFDIYYGDSFSHQFDSGREYFIKCDVSLYRPFSEPVNRSINYCIARPIDEPFGGVYLLTDSNSGQVTPVSYTCGNVEDGLCGTGGNSAINVSP